VGLVQNGFAVGQGNWGANIGIEPLPAAAQRYTEVRVDKDILNLAFEYIKAVPYDAVEMDNEPIFLPTKLPLCLLGEQSYCQGMGFGYRTLIPCYTKSDLLKRLEWLLGGKKGNEPIIKPVSDCKIKSPDPDIKQLLTTGKSKIEFVGKYRKDGPKSIIIESIPPSKSFQVILKKFNKEITVDKSLGFTDESKTSSQVRLTIIKPRMLKMAQLEKKLKPLLQGSLTFECHMCNTKGKVVLLSIDNILLNVYNVYRQVVGKVLQQQSAEIQKHIDELKLIELIKPLLSQELKANPDDLPLVIKNIAASLKQTQEVIKGIFDKYTLSRIFRIKTDTQQLLQQKQTIDANFANLTNYIWKEKYLK
jgi:DNA gyrase/topoisomerase IV subunit A